LLTGEGNVLKRGGPGCHSRNSVWRHLDSDKNMIVYKKGEQKKLVPHRGVWRHTGANGLKKIDAYKKMAKMAHEHWLNNPEGVWNPDINKARANL